MTRERCSLAWLQAGPMLLVFALFFLLPLALVIDGQLLGLQRI